MSLKPSIWQIVNPFFLQDWQDANPSAVSYPLNVADWVKGWSSVVDPLSLDIAGLPTGTLATTTELAINNGAVNEKTTLSDLATFLDNRDVYSVADITALNAITGMDTGDVAIVADTFDLTGEHVAGSYVYDGTNWLLESRYAVTLNNLLDVNAPSPVAWDILQWNGTQWVNNSSGGGGSSYIPPYLKTGGASWSGTGLVYDVTALEYYFNGDKNTSATQVTLDASDPVNNRLDAIVVDEAGVVSVIKGDASASPISPSVDESHILVQYILVEAGSTQPTIAKEDIYLENVEWTTSTYTTGTATGSIDFNNAVSPKQGVKCISANADARLGARFVRATSFDPYQYTMLSMWVRFTGSNVATNKSLNVRFENGAGTLVANTINLFSFGLQRNLLNVWQLVVIPITSFGVLPTSVKGLKIIMTGGTVGQARQWDIDLISLTDNSVPSINEQAFNVLKDGALVGQSSSLNFKGAVTVTNDPINKKIDVEVIGGGGTPAGSQYAVQVNDGAGAFEGSSDLVFDYTNKVFQAGDVTETVNHNWIEVDDDKQQISINGTVGGSISTTSPVFSGPGLNDLNLSGSYSGSGPYPTDYEITITDVNISGTDVLGMPTGGYIVGETITGLSSGATGTVVASTEYNGRLYLTSITGTFTNGETLSGSISGTAGSINDPSPFGSVSDIYELVVTPYLISPTTYILSSGYGVNIDGFYIDWYASTGHTINNTWTWQVINSTVYGNSLYIDTSTQGEPVYKFGDVDEVATGDRILIDTGKGEFKNFASILWSVNDISDNSFLKIDIDKKEYSIGDIDYSNNGTKITIDDGNEQITISNLSAYDDDTAAGVGGLTAGMVYMTTGSGSAPLNAAGILMIKQ